MPFYVQGARERRFLSELINDHTQPIINRLAECEAALDSLPRGSAHEYFKRWPRIGRRTSNTQGKEP
jgi:hypothetical protein